LLLYTCHTMSYSPMQDACPHSIPISDKSSGDNSYC
jgi:hypothetical protein